jgi:Ca-activated chloride channel family protein
VTALYEITLTGSKGRKIEPLRYGKEVKTTGNKDELAWLRLRYKLPGNDTSRLIEQPLKTADIRSATAASPDFRFAAAVAAFGQQLRGGQYTGAFSHEDALRLAREGRGPDRFGYRGEFISLVNLASSLAGNDSRSGR